MNSKESKQRKQTKQSPWAVQNAGGSRGCAGIEVIDLGEAEVIVYDDLSLPVPHLEVRHRHRLADAHA